MEQYSILLIDDLSVIRESIIIACRDSLKLKIIGETDRFDRALSIVKQLNPDLVLMDINLQHVRGFSAASSIKKVYPKVKILIISTVEDENLIYRMISCGIEGYLLKGTCMREVFKAIEKILEGEYYFSEKVAHSFVAALQKRNSHRDPGLPQIEITEREAEILKNIVSGLTNRQIAEKLCISTSTVKNHRNNLIRKTGARNTAQLVNCAVHMGLLF